jgi:Trypsin-co-occurring domain 1
MYTAIHLSQGRAFLVESEPEPGVVRAGRTATVKESAETFEQSLAKIRQIAEAIVENVSMIKEGPEKVRAEFGITLSAEAGLVVAKGTAEAHFVLELEWRRSSSENASSPGEPDRGAP